MDDLLLFNKDDLSSTTIGPSKTRLILPPIMSRQGTLSSFGSNGATTSVDNETNNRFTLPSRQNTFMKSISEIS